MRIHWQTAEIHGAPQGGTIFVPSHPSGHTGNHLGFDAAKYANGTTLHAVTPDGTKREWKVVTETTGEKVWQPSDYDPHTQSPPNPTIEFTPLDWAKIELVTPED